MVVFEIGENLAVTADQTIEAENLHIWVFSVFFGEPGYEECF